jgi:hypothetical protein
MGNLVHLHNPGEVPFRGGGHSPAKSRADYAHTPDGSNGNIKGVAWNDFWISIFITLYECVICDALILQR